MKLLIPSLLAAGMVAMSFDASAADEKKASKFHAAAKETRTFGNTAYYKVWQRDDVAKSTKLESISSRTFDVAEPSHTAPELSGSAAGSSLALLGGGLLALMGCRKRKARTQ
jgi:hypothetical protein